MIGYDSEVFIMNPKISVIIPAYNAEKTLRRCLDSAFASDFLDSMEIILVNDGSKDGTLKVAEEYKKHPNFDLIDQPNGGVARARWTGISKSRGEYLGFVDADDYIAPDMMSRMYQKAQSSGSKIVICGWYNVSENSIYPVVPHKEIEESGKEALKSIILEKRSTTALWNKIIQKQLIDKDEYSCILGIINSEDTLLLSMIFKKVNSVSFIDIPLYFYTANPSSISMNQSYRSLRHYLHVHRIIYRDFAISEHAEFRKFAYSFYVRSLLFILKESDKAHTSNQLYKLKNGIKEYLCKISSWQLLKIGKFRLFFELVLVKLGMYKFLYDIWRMSWFFSIRKWWRRRGTKC